MGLKRFDYKLPRQRKSFKQIAIVLCICLIAVLSFTSYALYEVRHPNDLVNSKVGEFNTSDVSLAILVDGVKQKEFPTKDSGKVFEKLECTNSGIASWNSETWKLTINDITGPTECTISFRTGVNAVDKLTELAKTNTSEMFTDDTADANIRYMGVDPANYVDIGNGFYDMDLYYGFDNYGEYYGQYENLSDCQSSTSKCVKVYSKGDNILWRIIGVMNNVEDGTGKKETRLKIIRNNSIGTPAWGENRKNNWETASLNTLLNNEFYTGQGIYTTNGLKTVDKNLIGEAVYHLGGATSSDYNTLTTLGYYISERSTTVYSGNPTTWTGKIGLMYPSDYGYATSGGSSKNKAECTTESLYYWQENNYSDCKNNDWLFKSNMFQWTITPESSNGGIAMNVNPFGYVFQYNGSVSWNKNAVYPVVYLKSDVKITGGTGTKTDPYKIGL